MAIKIENEFNKSIFRISDILFVDQSIKSTSEVECDNLPESGMFHVLTLRFKTSPVTNAEILFGNKSECSELFDKILNKLERIEQINEQ